MPQLYRVYRTYLGFIHKVADNPNLVDKACLVEHTHEPQQYSDHNLVIKLMDTGTWIDFKTIKERVEALLNNVYRKDLGEVDAETLTNKLVCDIAALFSLNLAQVKVLLYETDKYGVSFE